MLYIAREQVHFYHRSILLLGKPFIAFVQELSERAEFVHVGVWVNITHSGAPIQRSAGGLAKCARYDGGSLYRGPFPHILLLLG